LHATYPHVDSVSAKLRSDFTSGDTSMMFHMIGAFAEFERYRPRPTQGQASDQNLPVIKI
jgi:DNA invertase Pin-like site-specific DNA recombinase